MKTITFSYHQKTKRYITPVDQKPIVSAYNKLSPEHPDYFWEHMKSSPLERNLGPVIDALLNAGYCVIVIQ